ncbi:MAG: sulfite exporter TauE/SafE family protein [Actinomycetota bacterium]|nr:sulfite exporter TauE/SafE family protein [Actinomycetota bacterium]
MSFAAGYVVAFGGGIISFLSPCVLPLVPAYLSVVTGIDVVEFRGSAVTLARATRTIRTTFLFILGFSVVFIMLGLVATSIGKALFMDRVILTRISGVVLIGMGGFLLASQYLRLPYLFSEKRFHPRLTTLGPYAAPVAGMAFAFGWTPCIGPILSSVLSIAAVQGQSLRGGLLLAAYSLGLGVPFLVAGLAFTKLESTFGWIRRHFAAITVVSSLALVFFGLLLATDRFIILTQQLSNLMNQLDLGRLVTLG